MQTSRSKNMDNSANQGSRNLPQFVDEVMDEFHQQLYVELQQMESATTPKLRNTSRVPKMTESSSRAFDEESNTEPSEESGYEAFSESDPQLCDDEEDEGADIEPSEESGFEASSESDPQLYDDEEDEESDMEPPEDEEFMTQNIRRAEGPKTTKFAPILIALAPIAFSLGKMILPHVINAISRIIINKLDSGAQKENTRGYVYPPGYVGPPGYPPQVPPGYGGPPGYPPQVPPGYGPPGYPPGTYPPYPGYGYPPAYPYQPQSDESKSSGPQKEGGKEPPSGQGVTADSQGGHPEPIPPTPSSPSPTKSQSPGLTRSSPRSPTRTRSAPLSIPSESGNTGFKHPFENEAFDQQNELHKIEGDVLKSLERIIDQLNLIRNKLESK